MAVFLKGFLMGAVILVSREDPVALNVLELLVENYGFGERLVGHGTAYGRDDIEAITISGSPLYSDDVVAGLEAELVIVPSRHKSVTGKKSLLAHAVGNWDEDVMMGGRPRTLSATSAQALFRAVNSLMESIDSLGLQGWEVGMEVTHHGPYSYRPIVFVELGSTSAEWGDRRMAEIVAEACLRAWDDRRADEVAVGFGGGHYARRFVQLLCEGVAFGHIAPRYRLPLQEEMVAQAFSKTIEGPSTAYIEWDGMRSEHREGLIKAIRALGKDFTRC